ncbi:pyrazinamidase/nicotinamidase-like protein, partial [Euroglyphus maynei]
QNNDPPFKLSNYLVDINAISPILNRPYITNGHQAIQTVRRWALIIVDVQNDFVHGSMALNRFFNGEEAAEVIPAINRLLKYVEFDLVVYSRDWHPIDHCSFNSSSSQSRKQIAHKWPEHCVENTWGAQYVAGLITDPASLNPNVKKISITKGMSRDEDCYSAFGGSIVEPSSLQTLADKIKSENIDQIFVCGLATDYCVRETCYDAKTFCPQQEVFLLVDASRGRI